MTGRNLLSPVLTGAAADVEAFDAKVTAANGRASESSAASAKVQETSAEKVAASNVRSAESSSAASAKVVAANARAAESARAFADVTESSSARAVVGLSSMATKGAGVAAAAVAAIAVVTGKMAGDYQSALTRLSTTAGESQGNLKMVGQGMLDMAGQVGVSAQELAKGMYVVDSAGIHGADSLVVLKAAAQGARQENADLSHVVDAVTTSLHDFHLPASDAAKVTSELIAAVSHGKTTFDDLTGSMHSIEPVAVGAGMNIAQTAGALAAMTASGMHADQAAQNLAHTIGSFQNATKPMRDELFQLGLDSQDLQQHMGERGIAGTLQLIADRIRGQIDPSGHLLLNALQTNKTAVNDLSIMIGKMPPQLADMATGLLAGTTSQKDFTLAAKALGGEAGAMADQFLASYKGADGFSAALKSGGPMVQTYISALAKATGTSDGLRTALMLTGENADSTNGAIAAVGKAAGDTKGNIQGWDEVQGNFNQKLAQAGAAAKSLAIEAGQHLLPVLTGTVGWIGTTGLPGIERFGHGVGDVAHWFSELPGPVRDAALALGALKLAETIGLTDRLSSAVGSMRASYVSFREESALQQSLWAMNQRSAIETGRAYGDMERTLGGFGLTAATAGAGATNLEGKLGTLAARGMSGLKAGATGLMDMFGGPWMVALAGAGIAVAGLVSWLQKDHDIIPKVSLDTQGLTQAIQANNGAIDDNVRRQAAMSLQQAGLFKAATQWGISLKTLTDAALGNSDAMAQVSAAAGRYKAAQDAAASSTAVQNDQTGLAADAYKKAGMQSDVWLKAIQGVAGTTEGQVADAKQITEAVNGTATATQGAAAASDALKTAVTSAGLSIQSTWDANTAVLGAATAQQIKDLKDLGLTVYNLPNGNVVVTSDTGPARAQMDQLAKDYANKQIAIAGGNAGPAAYRVAGAGTGGLAGGGPVVGPGTGTSDTAGLFALSNGEHVWTAAETDAAGGHAGVESLRKAVLAQGHGRAAGGAIGLPDNMRNNMPAALSQLAMKQAEAIIASMVPTFTGGGGGAGSPLIRALGQNIANAMGYGGQFPAIDFVFSHESSWNPNAQNPSSSAYGIPQFLSSTWAQYGGKTSDPATQIRDGIRYMVDRYGSPNSAASFWQGHHWYKDGTNYVPTDQLAVLHKGEAVVPAAHNQGAPFNAAAMPGYGAFGGGRTAVTVAAPAAPAVHVHFYVDGQEFRGMTRTEIDTQLGQLVDTIHYAGG